MAFRRCSKTAAVTTTGRKKQKSCTRIGLVLVRGWRFPTGGFPRHFYYRDFKRRKIQVHRIDRSTRTFDRSRLAEDTRKDIRIPRFIPWKVEDFCQVAVELFGLRAWITQRKCTVAAVIGRKSIDLASRRIPSDHSAEAKNILMFSRPPSSSLKHPPALKRQIVRLNIPIVVQ
jgi:hypothetical protein